MNRAEALRAIAHSTHRPAERFSVADQFVTPAKHLGVDGVDCGATWKSTLPGDSGLWAVTRAALNPQGFQGVASDLGRW